MATWLITGCSSGLGKGIALAALERGESVALTARNPDTLTELVKKYPDQALALRLDLNDHPSISNTVSTTYKHFGRLDVLVNNAGHGYRAAVEESERERIEELFETNFFAVGELISKVLPIMRNQRSGLIVNVTSIGAIRGAAGNGYYGASKAAVELLTEALSQEVSHLGIRTLIVEPGAMRTAFFDDALLETKQHISDYDAIAQKYRKSMQTNHHNQPINPKAAGRVIVDTILSDSMPKRLLLGSDCVKAARNALKARLAEIDEWAEISAQADFSKSQPQSKPKH